MGLRRRESRRLVLDHLRARFVPADDLAWPVARLTHLAVAVTRQLLLLAAFVSSGRAVADEELETLIRKEIESSKKFSTRVNGVKLDATVEVIRPDDRGRAKDRQKSDRSEASLAFHWTLDYDGPRQPLIILKPSLELPTNRQTTVEFIAFASNMADATFAIHSPTPRHPIALDQPFFMTVPAGTAARGTILVEAEAIKRRLKTERVQKRVQSTPAFLLARLRHCPFDRGRRNCLDAWTGELQTRLFLLSVEALGLN